jgi:LasA protease
VDLADGNSVRIPPGVNPGTAAVQNLLARQTTYANWLRLMAPDGFRQTYRRLFGEVAQYASLPTGAADIRQPPLRLPWADGQTWFYTGGPHPAWGDGSPRAAIDFGPPGADGCFTSPQWVVAAADGLVDASEHGRVAVNLGGNPFQGVGWTILYMHMADEGRVARGARVRSGDPIGHPSCAGGLATGSHLHFTRLYNGQWIDADGSLPLDLSGWLFRDLPDEYDGTAERGPDVREAAIDHAPSLNGIEGELVRPAPLPNRMLHGDTLGTPREPVSGR